MDPVIETHKLTKRYGPKTAVDGLDLTLEKGEVFGLLGPNGSGKTTTILMILGLTEPTSGKVRVLGVDPARRPLQVKTRVGYLPDQVGFYDDMTARENLSYTARLNRIPSAEAADRIISAMHRIGLSDEVVDQQVGTFSHGMRQRLGLAELLVKEPEVVILDEPTLGLDPEAAHQFLRLIRGLKDDGITILLASHLLHQVQAVCDRVGLFRNGKMFLEGPVRDLAHEILGGGFVIHLESDDLQLAPQLEGLEHAVRVTSEHAGHYRMEARADLRQQVARLVLDRGSKLLSMHLDEPSLDEVYASYFEEVPDAS
jgi:ABC-2 type transport system ATP-binding protein